MTSLIPHFRKFVLLMATSFICTSSFAQSKVGFVNTEKILKESAPAQEAMKLLMNEFSKRESSLADLAADIKRKSDRLERDGATMAGSERQRLQSELADSDARFQRERRNLEEEVQSRRSQLLSGILERANREVVRIAELEKIDIVFQDAVWASPRIDITNRVLDALKK
jgi:outer membrane protein